MRRFHLPLVVLASVNGLALAAAAQTEMADEARDRLADDATSEPAAEEGGEGAPPAEASEGFGGDEDASRPAEAPAEGGDTPSSAPESYTVQSGDTLWGLSQRFLNNPWYWPKIWSYNPQLDNPNWIRPGTVVRFYPGEEPVVEVKPEPDEEPEYEDVGEGGGFEQGKGLKDRLENLAGRGAGGRRREFFIPSEKVNDQGQVLNSPEETRYLTISDRTYVKLKSGGPGDTLQIFRTEREVRHPVTGAALGQMVLEVGELRVDQQGKEQALGTVTAAWDAIERGQYVGALPVRQDRVNPVPNGKNVKGYVVEAAPQRLSFVAEGYLVVVDKGSSDGVEVGNTFTVVRAGDPYTRQYSGLSDEDIGELIVLETFKSSSTALLTAASREVVPGDRCEMRVK
ncbi:MAG: LysM peptidoglycan-binding domain-containing protein [Deltaproteobacteria bacterium]|nr:LysM peptidoglycan-binding domain-containing protein [Deltaproteobacteria bacterium]